MLEAGVKKYWTNVHAKKSMNTKDTIDAAK